jgi:putative transposase
LTDSGSLEFSIPRERQSSFEPQLLAKYQRLPRLRRKDRVDVCAGMSTREIAGHVQELCGVDVSPDLIFVVTDAVLDEVAAWQSWPLEPVYPLVVMRQQPNCPTWP